MYLRKHGWFTFGRENQSSCLIFRGVSFGLEDLKASAVMAEPGGIQCFKLGMSRVIRVITEESRKHSMAVACLKHLSWNRHQRRRILMFHCQLRPPRYIYQFGLQNIYRPYVLIYIIPSLSDHLSNLLQICCILPNAFLGSEHFL